MSRLLHAAARGARLDRLGHITGDWIPDGANYEAIQKFPEDFRIHPEDAHLQYGPISSELRAMAENKDSHKVLSDSIPTLAIYSLFACDLDDRWLRTWPEQTPDERRIALCVMAEALADEGL